MQNRYAAKWADSEKGLASKRRGLRRRRRKERRSRPVYAILTREEWIALFQSQGGRCAMCSAPLKNRWEEGATGLQASLDHSHSEEKRLLAEGVDPEQALRRSVRGLLCSWKCNRTILPLIRDCPDMARRTADYLDNWPSRKIGLV